MKKKIQNFSILIFAYFSFYSGYERRQVIEQLGKRLEEIRSVDIEKIHTNRQLKTFFTRIADYVKFIEENNVTYVVINQEERKFRKSTQHKKFNDLAQDSSRFIRKYFPKIQRAVKKYKIKIAELRPTTIIAAISEEKAFNLYYLSLEAKFKASDLDNELSINTLELLNDLEYLAAYISKTFSDKNINKIEKEASDKSALFKELRTSANRQYDYYRLSDYSRLKAIANAINDSEALEYSLLLKLSYKDVLTDTAVDSSLDENVRRTFSRDYPELINSAIRVYNFISEHLIQESLIVVVTRFFWETAGKLAFGYLILRLFINLLNWLGIPIPFSAFFSV